jgi:16S rRNA (guanine527-N7)-methyltransferase
MDEPDRSSLPRRASPPSRAALPRSIDGLPEIDRAFWHIIDAGLQAMALDLSAGQRAAIAAQARLLLAWNAHVNLSGLRTVEQIARGHVLDALLGVAALRGLGRVRPSILDLGSGAGYPGLPLALALPAGRAALVDSIGKKQAFLEVALTAALNALRAISETGTPEIVVLAERAEDLADEPDQREAWDLVTARAVGSVAEVAELGLPLVRRGGHVAAWKIAGVELEAEIDRAARLIEALGGVAGRIVNLPEAGRIGLAGHCLVVIDKRRPTPDRYPRSPGERRRGTLP